MRINTNIASLNAQNSAAQVNKNLGSSLEKLSTGLRINKASDDASGMAIADKLKIQASSLGQSINNANSASALIQIADKAMGEQSNILDIVKTKLIQAKDATTSSDGRKAILNDIKKLLTQLDNIASTTNYNGTTLLQSSSSDKSKSASLSFQVGEDSSNTISSNAAASNTQVLGGGSATLTTDGSAKTITTTGTQTSIAQGTTGATTMIDLHDSGATQSGNLDITLAGKIDKLSGAGTADTDITLVTTNVDDITFLNSIADNSAALAGSGGTYTLEGNLSISLNGHDFAGLEVDQGGHDALATTGAGVSMYTSDTVNITNNAITGVAVSGKGTDVIGGDLLSSLKSLTSTNFTASKAGDFMSVVDTAVTQLNTTRSDFGSTQNQLESAIRNMSTTQTNIKAAESSIRDVDYAQESANFNKQNIIAQAGTYAMSQANAIQQNVLRLLQ